MFKKQKKAFKAGFNFSIPSFTFYLHFQLSLPLPSPDLVLMPAHSCWVTGYARVYCRKWRVKMTWLSLAMRSMAIFSTAVQAKVQAVPELPVCLI